MLFRFQTNQIVDNPNIHPFWTYFEKKWIKNYGPTLWNIRSVFNDHAFAGRTNNSVERNHRRLTENFANAHPNSAAFVEVIRKEFKYYEERITEKRQNGSRIRYEHPEHEKTPNNSRISTG
ncbi:hypothetical protein HZS_6145 [Henneguya salminicola]|nr:hypothetical protein HZS_6145 [Henneguya salminicola]